MDQMDPIEKHLLLEGIFLRYGYDFRQYADASMERRLQSALRQSGCPTAMSLLELILRDKQAFAHILPHFTVTTTEFFRNPQFFLALTREVFPVLETYSSLRIWIAGCSTGEELYSLLVLLKEAHLLEKSTVYATDINTEALGRTRAGVFDLAAIQAFTRRYLLAGGKANPSDYYTAHYGRARFDQALSKNVVIAEHNLVTDHVFAEMHLILCRNVFIYFSRALQDQVFHLFQDSLAHRGFLGIGGKESMLFTSVASDFEPVVGNQNVFQKKSVVNLLRPEKARGAS